MTGMIVYCGLSCQTCPIYLATRQENKEEQTRMRVEIAQLCKEQYGMDYAAGRNKDAHSVDQRKECAILSGVAAQHRLQRTAATPLPLSPSVSARRPKVHKAISTGNKQSERGYCRQRRKSPVKQEN